MGAEAGLGMAAPMVGMGNVRMWIPALLLAISAPAHAEIYRFESELVPPSRTLVGKYMFYVYAHQDSPDKSKGHPYVQFTDFDLEEVEHLDDSTQKVSKDSIQVSLVPWEDFETLVDTNHFCTCGEDVMKMAAKADKQVIFKGLNGTNEHNTAGVHVYTVGDAEGQVAAKPASKMSSRQALKRTGVYLLAISNCGDTAEVTVSGKVVVRNAYGFLPGNEYGKKIVYAYTTGIYLAMLVYWASQCVQYSDDLIFTHYCLFGVIAMGLVESSLWFIHLVEWNSSGEAMRFLLTAAMLFSGLKHMMTLLLVLVTAMGKGVTVPTLEGLTTMRLLIWASIFICFNYSRMYIMEMRHRYSLSVKFTGLAWVPTLVLAVVFVSWICLSMSNTKSALREQGQQVKLATFSRFQLVFCLMVPVGAAIFGMQLTDVPGRTSDWWNYHWMSSDASTAVAGILFYLVMMMLWGPTDGFKRQAYSQQITATDEDEAGVFAPEGFGSAEGGVHGEPEVAEQMEETTTADAKGLEPDTIGAQDKDEV